MISRVLFESLLALAAAWVAVEFTLIAVWSWRRSRRCARTALAGFIALPVLIGVSSFVATDREEIIAICRHLADAVEAGDVDAIGRQLTADCTVEDVSRSALAKRDALTDRDAFLDAVEETLTRYHIWDVNLWRFELTFSGDNVGIARFHATARARSAELVYDRFTSRWQLTFRRSLDTWLVTRIEPLPTPHTDVLDLGRLLRPASGGD